MTVFNEENWPIVTIAMGEAFDEAVVQLYIDQWEKALARQERFGLLIVQPADRVERPGREATQAYMAWCKANKPRIVEYCAGMALVFPSTKLLLMYKPMAALSTRKMYGCPGKAFAEEQEALDWLNESLGRQSN